MPPDLKTELSFDPAGARALIVDDIATNRFLLRAAAEQLGFVQVEEADSGFACLERLARNPPIDLVLLDVMMPDLDGFETCRRIRQELGLADLPIILQTALASGADRVKGFTAGATDYVTKPLNMAELVARIQVHLGSRQMMRRLRAFHDRLTSDLAIAHRMQRRLIPDVAATRARIAPLGLEFDAAWVPCEEVGGDFWLDVPVDESRVGLLLVDITGHGLVAAINVFRLHGVLRDVAADPGDPAAWLADLNRRVCEELDGDTFATAFYAVIDARSGRVAFAAAGSPEPIIVTADGRCRTLESRGLMLGVAPDHVYEARETVLEPGAGLLLYSDAATESPSGDGRGIGLDGFMPLVCGAHGGPQPIQAIMAELSHRVPAPWADDMTLVWIGRRDD